jgi:hypothetical protein
LQTHISTRKKEYFLNLEKIDGQGRMVSTLPGLGNVIATEYTLQNNNDVSISKAII